MLGVLLSTNKASSLLRTLEIIGYKYLTLMEHSYELLVGGDRMTESSKVWKG